MKLTYFDFGLGVTGMVPTSEAVHISIVFFHFSFHYVTALAVKFGLPSSGQQQQCRAS